MIRADLTSTPTDWVQASFIFKSISLISLCKSPLLASNVTQAHRKILLIHESTMHVADRRTYLRLT